MMMTESPDKPKRCLHEESQSSPSNTNLKKKRFLSKFNSPPKAGHPWLKDVVFAIRKTLE